MVKRSIWKRKFEKLQVEHEALQQRHYQDQMDVAYYKRQIKDLSGEKSGLCDLLRSTAEHLESRELDDTARHLRLIADNYAPRAASAVDGCDRG